MTRQNNGKLTVLDKINDELRDKALAQAEQSEPADDAPPFEIDPDVPLDVQLAIVTQQLASLKAGRSQLKLQYRVNKYSFKNEQAAATNLTDMIKQEAAISDVEVALKIVQGAIEAEKK